MIFRRVLAEHECAVVVQRKSAPLLLHGPGSVRMFRRWRRVSIVDLRPLALDVPPEEVLTRDHVPVMVSGQLQARVVDPVAAVEQVVDYKDATQIVARTAMRAILKERLSSELASPAVNIDAALVEEIDSATRKWGVADARRRRMRSSLATDPSGATLADVTREAIAAHFARELLYAGVREDTRSVTVDDRCPYDHKVTLEEPEVRLIPLQEPRPLSARERGLLEFMVHSPMAGAELRQQARGARVVGVCSCGCPSIVLGVDPSAPSARYEVPDVPYGRTDVVGLTASQRKSRGFTEVTLHVVQGRLHELEIWGGRYGLRPRIELAKLEHQEWTHLGQVPGQTAE